MLFKLQDKSSPPSYTHYAMLYHVIPTKWRSYRGHRFCDVNSPYAYMQLIQTRQADRLIIMPNTPCDALSRFS